MSCDCFLLYPLVVSVGCPGLFTSGNFGPLCCFASILSNILLLKCLNFASSYDDVWGLVVWCAWVLVGLRTAGTGFLRALLYPMPIAGGEPEAALEIVVAGMVGGLVDDVIGVGGGCVICVRLSGRISLFPSKF